MLSIARISNIDYYQNLSQDDYYRTSGDPAGAWFGDGASELGLNGEVLSEDFRAIFAGRCPDGRAIQNAGKKTHRPGWDLTFSAPKSVSVLWAVSDENRRAEILRCHNDAVHFALRLIEAEAGWSRKGKGGRFLERAALVFALFQHGTSRELDPAIHTHALAANLGISEDGRVRTIHSPIIYRWKMALGAIYRAAFANFLQERLGLQLTRSAHGFEVRGIAKRACDWFSKRRKQIETELARSGRHSARASEFAALGTRRPKQEHSASLLHSAWQSVAGRLGFSPARANELFHSAIPKALDPAKLAKHIDQAIEHITHSQAHFTKREVIREVAASVVTRGVSADQLVAAVERHLHHSPELIHLVEMECERHYTTKQVIELEAQLLANCDALHSRKSLGVPEATIEKILQQFPGIQKRPEQANALRHILSAGTLKALSGMPGTGKTFVLDAAREAWERMGYRVVSAALAGRAARELEDKSHIPSDTIAKLLHDLEATPKDALKHHGRQLVRATVGRSTSPWTGLTLDANTVLAIDECGMVDTVSFHRLIFHAMSAGAKVVLLGDPQQLPPIEAGAPFRAILSRFPSVHLQTIERQKDPRDIEAIHALSRGDARTALRNYEQRGLLSVEKDRKSAIERLVRDWSERGGIQHPSSHAILVATNADRLHINAQCQQARFDARRLDPESYATIRRKQTVEGLGTRVIREDFHVGDRVMCLERWRARGLENGDMGTVTGYDREAKNLTIRFDAAGSKPRSVAIPVKMYPHLTLAYAATTHKFQGATVDYGYVLMGGSMQSREMTHTQLSRAKHSTRIYVDELEAGENLQGLITQVERSQAKRLAHEMLPIDGLRCSSDLELNSALRRLSPTHQSEDIHLDISLRPFSG